MGKIHLLALSGLGEAWVYPENRVDPTNPLGIRHCQRAAFPLLEFSTFENSCFNMTDVELVEGTECQFECDTGSFDIGAFSNKVICECHIAHPGGDGQKSCFWHIPHGYSHSDYMCGKPLYNTIFAQSAANADNIRLETENAEATLDESIKNTAHDLEHLREDSRNAIVQLWEDMSAEIEARKARDRDIEIAINAATLQATQYFLAQSVYANITARDYARDAFNSIGVQVAENCTETEYQVKNDVEQKLRDLKIEVAMRTLTWKEEIKQQIVDGANTIKDDAVAYIQGEATTLKSAIDTGVADYKATKTSEIQDLGTDLQNKHDSLLSSATADLTAASTGKVTQAIDELKTTTKGLIEAQITDFKTYTLLEADLLEAVNAKSGATFGVICDGGTPEVCAKDKDSVENAIMESAVFGIKAYGDVQIQYIEDNTGADKIECAADTCLKGYLDLNGPLIRAGVESDLATKQGEIGDKNALSRQNALASAQLYADEIQNVLEVKIQTQIHDERFSLTNSMTDYRQTMALDLAEAQEKIAENLDAAAEIYSGSIEADFDMKEAMVQSANTTMNANLDEIREKFCDEITTHQTRTLGIIEYQKNEVAEKIAKLVAKVKFEMEHSKKQLTLLRANYFF